jgi:competence protein ComEA
MRRAVMIACAALLFLPVAMKSRTNGNLPVRTAFHLLSSGRIPVKVSGDVRHPGIYEVSANSMADSVIKMAEPRHPLKRFTCASSAARPLMSGAAVALQTKPDGSLLLMVDRMTVPECMILGIPLDISVMNEADFDRLPGIGPGLAKRIVEYRQNNGGVLRVDDLASVVGIGEKKYKALRPYFQHAENIE